MPDMPTIEEALIRLFNNIDYMVCTAIELLYGLIYKIADVNLFSKGLSDITSRIYVFVGIFALFKLSFIFINYILDPNTMEKGNKASANVVKQILIALALISIVPFAFSRLNKLQTIILKENVISKIIFGKAHNTEDDYEDSKMLTFTLYTTFLDYNTEISNLSNCNNIFMEEDTGDWEVEPVYDIAEWEEPEGVKHTADYVSSISVNLSCQQFLRGWYKEKKYPTYIDANGMEIEKISENDENEEITEEVKKQIEKAITFNSENEYSKDITDFDEFWKKTKDVREGLNDSTNFLNIIDRSRDGKDIKAVFKSEVLAERVFGDANTEFVFDYKRIITGLAGIAIAVILFFIALDIAIRTVLLGFLRLISPIIIISYFDPVQSKGSMFVKWLKLTLATFFDLFIRLASLFLAISIIRNLIFENAKGAASYTSDTIYTFQSNPLLITAIIIGAFLFALKLPKLIKDITGLTLTASTSFGAFKKIINACRKTANVVAGVAISAGLAAATAGASAEVQIAAETAKVADATKKGLDTAQNARRIKMIKDAKNAEQLKSGTEAGFRALKSGIDKKGENPMGTIFDSVKKTGQSRNLRYQGYNLNDSIKDSALDMAQIKNENGLSTVKETMMDNKKIDLFDKNQKLDRITDTLNNMLSNNNISDENAQAIYDSSDFQDYEKEMSTIYPDQQEYIQNLVEEQTYEDIKSLYELKNENMVDYHNLENDIESLQSDINSNKSDKNVEKKQ